MENIGDKNPAKNDGGTPLHCSARNGYTAISRLIIEKIADKNPATYHGWTPAIVIVTDKDWMLIGVILITII